MNEKIPNSEMFERVELIESKIKLLTAMLALILSILAISLFTVSAVVGIKLGLSNAKAFGDAAIMASTAVLAGICYQYAKMLIGIAGPPRKFRWKRGDTVIVMMLIISTVLVSCNEGDVLSLIGTYGLIIVGSIAGTRLATIDMSKK